MRLALALAARLLAATPRFAADAGAADRDRTVPEPGLLVLPAGQRGAGALRRPRRICSRSPSPSTYWDRLGWKDTFAQPEFTERQYAYARSLGGSGVYTPRGRGQRPRRRRRRRGVRGRGARAPRPTAAPPGRTCGSRAARWRSARGRRRRAGAEVWLALYDPRVDRSDGRARRERRAHAGASQRRQAAGAARRLGRRGRAAPVAGLGRPGARGAGAASWRRRDFGGGAGVRRLVENVGLRCPKSHSLISKRRPVTVSKSAETQFRQLTSSDSRAQCA